MFTVYKTGTNSSWKTELYGMWDEKKGFQKIRSFFEITSLRRLDLERYKISICYVLTNNKSIDHLNDGL